MHACGTCKTGVCGPAAKKTDALTPVAVPFATKITAVASGAVFNLAIDETGDVWSWGYSEHGVLGNGSDGEFNKAEGSVKVRAHTARLVWSDRARRARRWRTSPVNRSIAGLARDALRLPSERLVSARITSGALC